MCSIPTNEPQDLLTPLRSLVEKLEVVELASSSGTELLAMSATLETIRRRLDFATDRLAGAIERTGAHTIDGHRSAKTAIAAIGRLPTSVSHGRVATWRCLRQLPEVAAAYAEGQIPTESVRAIARSFANPRVGHQLAAADSTIAEQAVASAFKPFTLWLRRLEDLLDADGAAEASDLSHERRNLSMIQNSIDGSWALRGNFGALQGAAIAHALDTLDRQLFKTDLAEARAEAEARGSGSAPEVRRLPRQRRADALAELAALALGSATAGSRPQPLVNIVIDRPTFEAELARVITPKGRHQQHPCGPARAGPRPPTPPPPVCKTLDGHHLHPSDAVVAALVGHVRRVVVDGAGTVIDLGRKQRCFTGSTRDAAVIQQAISERGDGACLWAGCDTPLAWAHVDHREPWATGGATDLANAQLLCGHHNRLKEHGFMTDADPADGHLIHRRPDGHPITPII